MRIEEIKIGHWYLSNTGGVYAVLRIERERIDGLVYVAHVYKDGPPNDPTRRWRIEDFAARMVRGAAALSELKVVV